MEQEGLDVKEPKLLLMGSSAVSGSTERLASVDLINASAEYRPRSCHAATCVDNGIIPLVPTANIEQLARRSNSRVNQTGRQTQSSPPAAAGIH